MGVGDVFLEVSDLHVRYGGTEAVRGVSFDLRRGETLGIVGESGSGKSTIAKAIMGIERPYSGTIACHAKSVQMVFQDAVGSLNPRMTVRQTLDEVLKDADILQHVLQNTTLPIRDKYEKRFEKLKKEFSL